jgi:hypothetical protein
LWTLLLEHLHRGVQIASVNPAWCIPILNFKFQLGCVAALQGGPTRCRSWWYQGCLVEFREGGDWFHR